jgi:hypothetical protein
LYDLFDLISRDAPAYDADDMPLISSDQICISVGFASVDTPEQLSIR